MNLVSGINYLVFSNDNYFFINFKSEKENLEYKNL